MKRFSLLIILAFISAHLFAQKKKQEIASNNSDSVFFSKMKFRLVGPFRGGRVGTVCGDYSDRNTFYFGGAGGGVWKTTDGGSNWKNISDKYFGGSIGAVAVAPSDNNVLYVGEGENTLRGNEIEGLNGIWRSDDAGRTWRNIGLKDTRHIAKIVVHPRDPNTAWVAVIGHSFGPSESRGIYKTTDGGKTWKKVLYVNNLTAASDIAMEPGNPNVLYAGTWHIIRTPYSMESGGEGSGVWKSTDGGETWTNISAKKGLPKGVWGIVCIAVSANNPDKIFAMIENQNGGLYVSNDGGETWTMTSQDSEIKQRSWYFNRIVVDPTNDNTVYVMNVSLMRSTDGGKTFQVLRSPHSDHHDLWIDPKNGSRMILADDGGAQVSFDAGNNWSAVGNQPTAQFYRVSTDNASPYHILAAQQDNSTVRIKSRTTGLGITENDWTSTAGFESGYVVADPTDPEIVYGGNYDGFISRLDHKTGESRVITVWPDNPTGYGADALKYRFQWNFPLFFSPNNPKRLYAAGNVLFKTDNEGASWEAISPDLTTNDKSKQGPSGGPITKDNTSVEYYCTIFTAAESPLEKDLLWTGSDDGLINVSKDGGAHWENVTPKDAPKWMMWNCVEVDPFKKGTAYFVGTRYKSDDFTPYIYKTEDYGKSWTLITNGIDKMHFTRCLRADKKRQGLLYAGTEYGMYISFDDGAHWKPFQLNLPTVQIADMTIKNNDLVVATHGRAFYVLDDLSMLQQMNTNVLNDNLHVFDVNPVYRMQGGGRFRGAFGGTQANIGTNPPNGVVFNYWVKDVKDSAKASVKIFDTNHKEVKTFSTSSKENKLDVDKGMNQFVWDFQYPQAEKAEGMILWNGTPGGLAAAPGNYFARFVVEKDSVEVPFTIKADPTYKISQQDYEAQFNFLMQVRQKFNDVQKTIQDIRSLRTQINSFVALQGKNIPKDVKQSADTINKQLTAIEEELVQTKSKSGEDPLNFPIKLNDKIAGVYNVANAGNTAPTKQVRDVFADLSAQADMQLNKLKTIKEKDIPAFNDLIRQKALPVIGIKSM